MTRILKGQGSLNLSFGRFSVNLVGKEIPGHRGSAMGVGAYVQDLTTPIYFNGKICVYLYTAEFLGEFLKICADQCVAYNATTFIQGVKHLLERQRVWLDIHSECGHKSPQDKNFSD